MKALTHGHRPGARSFRASLARTTSLAALLALGVLLTLVSGAAAAPTAVSLGTAKSFAVLAGAGITNTGPTTLNGDLGTYPTTSFTSTGSLTVNGANQGGDAVTQGAQSDLVTAYNSVRDEGPTSPIAGLGGGQTLLPGVYNSGSTIGLTGALTLDGNGDKNAVFVFQAGSALTTASSSQINLINGAQSCNVFWQIGSDATLGTNSSFVGNLIALNSITVTTGVTVDGRVLARNGAVTLDSDTISASTCASTGTTATATTTTAGTTTTAATATTPTTTVGLVNAAPNRSTVVTAATRKARAAKASKAAKSAKAAAARVAATKAQAAKAAAATKLAAAEKLAAAKKLATAEKLATAKKLATANRLTTAKKLATAKKQASTSTHVATARPPISHVGLTG